MLTEKEVKDHQLGQETFSVDGLPAEDPEKNADMGNNKSQQSGMPGKDKVARSSTFAAQKAQSRALQGMR